MARLCERYQGAALITGASAGLGEAFARHCASEGMDVVMVSRRRERLELLADIVRNEYGVRALIVVQDLTQPEAPQAIKDACDAAGWTIGLLVNNAGFGSYSPFHETDSDWQNSIVEVNCKVPVALTSIFLPGMVERGNGGLVFLASTAAYQPAPMLAVYGASKAFSRMLGEALYTELKPLGIDALTLSPGFTKTEFHTVARVKHLPPSEMFRQPEQVVATCFKALGNRPSVIDRVTPLEARLTRWKHRLQRVTSLLATSASVSLIQAGELAVLF